LAINRQEKEKGNMKALIIALTIAATSTTILTAQNLSPRAELNKTRIVSGSTEDLIARGATQGSPRGELNKTRVVAGSEQNDTLAVIRNSRLSPRAQLQATGSDFQVAPLASKKSCDAPCCK